MTGDGTHMRDTASDGAVRFVPADLAVHRAYEAAGFADREPYEGAEVPKESWAHTRFMESSLR